jgi:ribA/ribD-fused uncharacterized protein
MAESKEIIDFYDPKKPYGALSNFYPSPIIIDDITYPTVEHYFQCMKFTDEWYRQKILEQSTPGKVKFLSSQRKGGRWKWENDLVPIVKKGLQKGVKMRDDWDEIKIDIMADAVFEKFYQNENLLGILLITEDAELREASPRDYYWGIGKDSSGKNMLGKILMCVRYVFNNQ